MKIQQKKLAGKTRFWDTGVAFYAELCLDLVGAYKKRQS
jgi:hypothetical protein